jgi:tetracycline 7-halogenase / FADH2 O2-dependent halogenase
MEKDHFTADQIWNQIIKKYPSVYELFRNSSLAKIPGKLVRTGRLQRKLDKTYSDGWLALHHTSGFVDPLHSTGIAFTLSGIEKITGIFRPNEASTKILSALGRTEKEFNDELFFIDKLVASCYKSRWNFPLFTATVMLYFIASVKYEQSRLRGEIPETFLCAGNTEIKNIVEETFEEIKLLESLRDEKKAEDIINRIRRRIKPHNNVGLMEPSLNNMYRHTAVAIS